MRTTLSVFTRSSIKKVFGSLFIFFLLLILLVSKNTQHMADRMFWLDEATTFFTAIQSFWEIPKYAFVTTGNMQPPIFYWFGHFFAKIGTDPLTLRSLSFTFYVLMIGFVFFALQELQFASRIFLCFVLIMSPFGAYATTEFRPYALAALSILISSVLLYRAIKQPTRWSSAILYSLAALVLQYSLTLNCFTFGLQMVFLGIFILASFYKEGFKQTFTMYKPLIVVSVLLSIQYAFFLKIAWHSQGMYQAPPFHLFDYIKHLWDNGGKLLTGIMKISSLTVSVAIVGIPFLLGCIIGLRRHRLITTYLILLLLGQLLFSTFMTFSRINWFHVRYLVASYIAFSLVCALGAEYLFQSINRKISVLLLVCLLGITLPVYTYKFAASMKTPKVNPSIEAIESLRCTNHETLVLCDPIAICLVPWYAYRNDPLLTVPDFRKDLNEVILQAAKKKICFILKEFSHPGTTQRYKGETFEILSELPDYTQKKYSIKPGRHIPDYAWLFTPKE